MRPSILYLGVCALLGCQGGPSSQASHHFAGTATACETLEFARTHAELLEADDPAEARQFASDRCFSVEVARPVTIVEGLFGGFLRGSNRWVRVASADGEPLEHHAAAELRRTLGLEMRVEGWVRRSELVEPQQPNRELTG